MLLHTLDYTDLTKRWCPYSIYEVENFEECLNLSSGTLTK